ncbi:MAG: PqqD family protein [Actinomycetota bacterium]|nr:PqqD family protein [Actinomycetota bacterium]
MTYDTVTAPRRHPAVRVHPTPDGAVAAAYAKDADPVLLNHTALALWELCDGQTTVAEMHDAVCELFALPPEQARMEIEQAMVHLRTAGLLT